MAQGNVGTIAVLRAMRREILPQVTVQLAHWREVADALADPRVRALALDSLAAKRFHCEGGAALALCAPAARRPAVVRAIVAVQTLSDFLDSWTDRPADGEAWSAGRVLAGHRAFIEAAAALPAIGGGLSGAARAYAAALADAARLALGDLPGLGRARPRLLALGMTYASMQAMKHGPTGERVAALAAWHRRRARREREAAVLAWPEFGAAAGSTLALFRLYAWAAFRPAQAGSRARAEAGYAPWASALHILLDALIDAPEDRQSGDLSWLDGLGGGTNAVRRLARLARVSRRRLAGDPLSGVLVEGLLATYLADPRRRGVPLGARAALWLAGGPRAWLVGLTLAGWGRLGVLGPRPEQAAGLAPPAAASTRARP